MLICPKCGAHVEQTQSSAIRCTCGQEYPLLPSGGPDFLAGAEFTDFDLDPDDLNQRAVLAQEAEGVEARMRDFLLPLIRRYARFSGKELPGLSILDCGCGSGLSVDLLREAGTNAWGLDAGASRHIQWRDRRSGIYLVSANALHIPFADGSFDAVLSSGLVEHIGIHEEESENGYKSQRLADCDGLRQQFVRELVRILKEDGFILLDHPNGAFPADFWHGGAAGSIRWHRARGDMLPRYDEVAHYFLLADPSFRPCSISPYRRLTFQKVGAHWYGRIFAPVMETWLRMMNPKPLSFLARTWMNPYLVTVASRDSRQHQWIYAG